MPYATMPIGPTVSQQLSIPESTVHACAKSQQLTPTHLRGRTPLLSNPHRQRLVFHATSPNEQRLKLWVKLAQELRFQADQRTVRKAFIKENYCRRLASD